MATRRPKKADNKGPELVSTIESAENVEQIGKDVIIGRKDVRYEDGKSVISVIINAISVRINMPRGTVKALMACFIILLLALLIYACNSMGSGSTDSSESASDTETQREYGDNSKAVNSERAASKDDYVIISSRFRYTLPDGFEGIWEPEDSYEQNETCCDFTYDGVPYTIRSYLLPYTNGELEDIVKASLSEFTGVEYLDEEYIESKYGRVLKIKFEVTDEDGTFSAVTGYYWSDIDPYVCCMEIISDSWQGDEVAEMMLDSVYRTEETQSSPAPDNAQELYDEQRKEDAMDSLVDDAMDDNYDYEPEEGAPL